MANKAKLILTSDPEKRPTAWRINIKDQGEYWIPFSFIQGYKPWTKEVEIDTWILDEKKINYKV
jgi:hypothetical protein